MDYLVDDFPIDSVWNLEDLEIEEFAPDEFDKFRYSYGWFASPPRHRFSVGILILGGSLFDAAREVRSSNFFNSPSGFSDRKHLTDNDMIIKKSFKDEDETTPERNNFNLGLSFGYNTGLPIVIRADALFGWQSGLLFTKYPGYSFMRPGGELLTAKQSGIVFIDETFLQGNIAAIIPIYGAFISQTSSKNIPISSVESYYYLFIGYSGAYSLSSELTQYVQITAPKDHIRFANGTDTLRLFSSKNVEEINKFRTYWTVGLGFNFTTNETGFRFEFYVSIPNTRVMSDVEWKQYVFGVRYSTVITEGIRQIFK